MYQFNFLFKMNHLPNFILLIIKVNMYKYNLQTAFKQFT